jgi:dihydropyrimidinase
LRSSSCSDCFSDRNLHCLRCVAGPNSDSTGNRYELTVRNGRVVTEDSVQLADLGVSGGKIAAIAPAGSLAPGATDVDATGLVVTPGGVDSHAHIEQRTSNGLTPVGDWYSASVSALCGGTTTVVPFACQHRGSRISQVIADYRELAKKSACDYAFHIIVTEPGEELVVSDLHDAFASGYSSVKVYMTYDSLKLEDEQLCADCLDAPRDCRRPPLHLTASTTELIARTVCPMAYARGRICTG